MLKIYSSSAVFFGVLFLLGGSSVTEAVKAGLLIPIAIIIFLLG